MHYADGSEARVGDLVYKFKKAANDDEYLGILLSGCASSTSCNGQVEALARRSFSDLGVGPWMHFDSPYNICVTIGECLPVSLLPLQGA
jgi:hypothetical protein